MCLRHPSSKTRVARPRPVFPARSRFPPSGFGCARLAPLAIASPPPEGGKRDGKRAIYRKTFTPTALHAGAEEVEEGEFERLDGDRHRGAMPEGSRGLRRAATIPPDRVLKKSPDPSGVEEQVKGALRFWHPLYVDFHLPCPAASRTGIWSRLPPGRGEGGGTRGDVRPWQGLWPKPRPAASCSSSRAGLLVQTRTVA